VTASNPERGAPSGSFAAFANPSFRSFTIAGMLWLMADNIEHVISYWVIFDKFDSPMLGGYAVISHWAPYLLLATWMGSVADRVDCRKLFIASMLLFMTVSLGWAYVFWTDTTAVWHAALFLTMHGLAGVLFTPASQLMIHDIVRPAQLTSAVRLTATSRQVSLIGGPAIGGLMLLFLGPALGIALNALIYLPMIYWSLTEPYTGHSHNSAGTAPNPRRGLGSVVHAIGDARQSRTVWAMIVLVGLASFTVGGAYQAQMPEFAKSLGESDGLLYTMLLLAAGFGAITGGLVQETVRSLAPTPRKAVVSCALWAVSVIAFAIAPNYVLALITLFIVGALSISFTSMSQALVQIEAPERSRGAIIGLYNTSINGMRVGSGLTVGFLGAVVGVHWSLGLSAALLLVAMLWLLTYVGRAQPVPAPAASAAAG
jgi:MFS family permease